MALPLAHVSFTPQYAKTSTALARDDDDSEDGTSRCSDIQSHFRSISRSDVDAPVSDASGPTQITVKQMKGGKSFTVAVSGQETVADLKKRIAEASGAPVDSQRLVFSGWCPRLSSRVKFGTLTRGIWADFRQGVARRPSFGDVQFVGGLRHPPYGEGCFHDQRSALACSERF